MRVKLSHFIESDLRDIGEWIADDNPRRAISFVKEIRDGFKLIGEWPLLYQVRPDIGEDARVKVVGRYPILFRIDGRRQD
jgi:plasmid stabilization system protein ParE